MNFVGHIHLALETDDASGRSGGGGGPDGDRLAYLVGAALPDIAAMGRFRLADRPGHRSVAAGVDLHHRTDDAFHRHPWFRANSKRVSERLEAEGLSRGAARACGHVGVELLLDGRLLETGPGLREAVSGAMGGLDDPGLDLAPLVDVDRRPAWASHLASVSAWALPHDYRQPAAVAARLQRILARRPRLSFTTGDVASVARVLSEQQATIEAGSARLVQDLTATLGGPPDPA